jgi:hypothetical protein
VGAAGFLIEHHDLTVPLAAGQGRSRRAAPTRFGREAWCRGGRRHRLSWLPYLLVIVDFK